MEHPTQAGPCYRLNDWSLEAYDEAITDLKNAREQRRSMLANEYQPGCLVCGDSGHTAGGCHHDPLRLARRWTESTCIYVCYHCCFIATNDEEAQKHFGASDDEKAECQR